MLDLITSDADSNTASVMLGSGDGEFLTRSAFSTGTYPYSVAIGDLDGDGVLDLVTADYSSNTASVLLGSTTSGVAPLLSFSLKTQAEALQALPILTRKLDQLSAQRGQLGGFESRVKFTVDVLQTSRENYAAAAARIMDADIAEESANLVRTQVMQQATTAVLAQANQQPALVLSLLK